MSTTGDNTKRTTIAIGPLLIDGLQVPDGSYRMSQTQAGESVGLSERRDVYAELDIQSEREARLEQQLRDLGVELWKLSGEE